MKWSKAVEFEDEFEYITVEMKSQKIQVSLQNSRRTRVLSKEATNYPDALVLIKRFETDAVKRMHDRKQLEESLVKFLPYHGFKKT